jgi:hypothetical protein
MPEKIDPKKLPPGLRVIEPKPPKETGPKAHEVAIQKGAAFSFKGKHFASHEEAVEEKIAHFFRENHKSYIGVAEIARFIRIHIDALSKICAEAPK